MIKYLPSKEELKPIVDKNTTFFECGFNKEFDLLDFKQKLQVVNDLVRQSILVDPYPDPKNEIETLTGNCYTAAVASIEYMKQLNLGKNHRLVLCRQRIYDPSDITTKHAAVLVDDDNGHTYLFDSTPYVASSYGEVLPNTDFYKEYEIIDGEKYELLFLLREFIFKNANGILDKSQLPLYSDVIKASLKYKMLDGYTSKACEIMAQNLNDKFDINEYIIKAIKLNPYSKYSENFKELRDLKCHLMNKQIDVWRTELNDLLSSHSNYKRQLKLAQNIYQEMKVMGKSEEPIVPLFGKNYRMTNMTPRFFMENKLNIIMIKPSAYYAGVSATIRERFLNRGNGALYEYSADLTQPTNITKLTPMLFSHTLGDKYDRAMSGKSDIILLQEAASNLYVKKKMLRKELCKNMWNRDIVWSDGEKIKWLPYTTNLIHSTDNPSEASLHFMMAYPEQQVMTRFMYPNKKLEDLSEEKEL